MLRTDIRQHAHGRAGQHRGPATAPGPEETATEAEAAPPDRELVFQRCTWCRNPDYRRAYCRACGSSNLARERSAGQGVVVRRDTSAIDGRCLVVMDEGFSLFCRVAGPPPTEVRPGTRVRVVSAAQPCRGSMPAVVVCGPLLYLRG